MRLGICFCDSSSVGRAAASQAAGRGFEPRLSLKTWRLTVRFFYWGTFTAIPLILLGHYGFCELLDQYSLC